MKKLSFGLWLLSALFVVTSALAVDFPFGASDPVYGLRSRIAEEPSFQYHPSPDDWRDINMYQIFTDRFASSGETLNYIQGEGWYVGNRNYPDNRNFHHGGDWKGLLQNLDYLEGMGVKAVWMSGVQINWQGLDTRFTPYHYYHPTDFFKVDPAQGTFEDLKNVIDAMHARGMYVVLDVVVNHMADLSGLWGNNREDNKWYHPNGNDSHGWWTDRRHGAPFDQLHLFHNHGRIRNWDSFPEYVLGAFPGTDDLRTSRQDVRDWLDLAFKNLIDATDCDGFRVDAIKHVEEDWIMQWADDMRKHAAFRGKHDFIIFGEYFTYDNHTLARYAQEPGYSFNSALFFPMSQTFKSVFVDGNGTGQLTQQLNNRNMYGEASTRLVTFIDNHDVNRIGLQAGGNVGHIEYIMPPALTFLYTATPVPCLFYGTEHAFQQGGHWNGQSAGQDYDDHDHQRETMFNKGFQPGPAQGNKLAATDAPLYQHIARLNQARDAHISLRRGNFTERWNSNNRGPYAFSRVYDDEEALVALNTSDNTESINPQVAKAEGTEFFNTLNPSETVTVGGDGRISFSLAPKESKIFIAGQAAATLWVRGTHNYPLDGDIQPISDIWINTEAGPSADVTNVVLVYSIDEGAWQEMTMTLNADWSSQGGDWYNATLGNLPAGTYVEYLIRAEGEAGNEVWDNNGGLDYSFTVSEGPGPDLWILNVSNWPVDGDATAATPLFVDAEAGPQDGLDSVTLRYSVDGGAFQELAMSVNADWGSANGYWFNASLGTFPAGSQIRYEVVAVRGEDTVVRNNGGQYYQVTIRTSPIVITDPASSITVSDPSYTVSGTSSDIIGDLSWTNLLTGLSGTVPATAVWTIPDMALAIGDNTIVVSGDLETAGTSTGILAEDNAGNYTDGWSTGSNEGSGFGAWTIEGDGAQGGTFIGANGFGFWSHEGGGWAAAIRPFASSLTEGQTFSIRMQNGWIWETGGSVGVALRDSAGEEKWALYFVGGADSYGGTETTDIDWTDAGVDIAFTLTGANSYSVEVTPVGGSTRTYTGTFTGTIDEVRAWSANNGTDDEFNSNRDYFINNLQLAGGESTPDRVSVSVTITREDGGDSNGDGVPDSFYNAHGLDPNNPEVGKTPAPNGYSYRESFMMNLDPDDLATPHFLMEMGPGGRPTFMAPGAARRYIVQHTANLRDDFVDIGEGINIGEEIELNGDALGFYRIRFLDHDGGGTGPGDSVSVSATPGSTTFISEAGITITLNVAGVNVMTATYSVDSGMPVIYTDGETITVGAGIAIDESVTVELYGETTGGVNDSRAYTYTRVDEEGPGPIAITAVGETSHFVSEDNNVWIDSRALPEGSSVEAYIVYCVNPPCEGDWPLVAMSRNEEWEDGDWWNYSLGVQPDGTVISFSILMIDGFGTEHWDDNDGAGYSVTIGDNGGGPIEPGDMTPPSTNPTFGQTGTVSIDGVNTGGEWNDDNLIAINLANSDPRTLGDNWTMHEAPANLTHLWARWDDNNLYLAWQFVDITDIIDPSNAGSAAGGSVFNSQGILQFISIDTGPGGAANYMWDKLDSFTGSTLPNVQIAMRSDLWGDHPYLSKAVGGAFVVDDDLGTNYFTRTLAGIQIAKSQGFVANALYGVPDIDDYLNNPNVALTSYFDHDKSRDTFYEMAVPLSTLGITRAHIESNGIGVFVSAGADSAVSSIPFDNATLDTPGVTDSNSTWEWEDGDQFTVPFARIGGNN